MKGLGDCDFLSYSMGSTSIFTNVIFFQFVGHESLEGGLVSLSCLNN